MKGRVSRMLKSPLAEEDRYLVYLVCLVCLVKQGKLDQQNKPDEPDKPDRPDNSTDRARIGLRDTSGRLVVGGRLRAQD